MKHVPIFGPNTIGNIAKDQMHALIREMRERFYAISLHNLVKVWHLVLIDTRHFPESPYI